MFGADLVVSLTNTSIGLAGATLIAQDWHAGWLIIPPAAVLILAYRAYLSEHTKHQSLEFLYGVARSLSRAPDVESALVDLLERTRDVVPRAHRGDHPVRRGRRRRRCARRSTPSGVSQTMQPVAHELATALRACLRDEHAVVVDRARRRRPALAGLPAPSTDIAEAAIAPVPGRDAAGRRDAARRPARRHGRLHRRRPAAVRDARRPRRHVARVRPPGAGDPAHARAAGRARAPGLPRPAHRPRQPRAVHAPRARVARPRRTAPAPCSSSTSTTSSASTTTPATPPATPC